MTSTTELQKIASQVRRDIIRMVHAVNSGHPGGSLGCTDFMTALYFDIMEHDPSNFTMEGKGQDVFYLSNGHISPLWYSILARNGYFNISELSTFRKINSRLQGHPATEEGLPGVRIASGSLGQGMSAALGHALAKKMDKDTKLVYSLHGDGELQEGQIWEAALFGASRKVDNIIATIDYNGQQIDGPVEKVNDLGDLKAKWEAFGWITLEMNGHDFDDILKTMEKAKSMTGQGKPVIILMHTDMGHGVDYMQGTHEWHGKAPDDELTRKALQQLPETLGDF
ncbi:MAG: transketolase [Bacteroidales bacterium]